MRRFLPLAACLLVMSCTAPASGEAAIVPSLIPQPAAMRAGAGSFTIDADTTVLANSDIAQRVAAHFNRLLTAANRPALEYSQDDIAGIHFDLRPEASLPPEGYRLTVQPGTEGIFVTASDEAGLFYGAVTLWQLLTQGEDGRVVLPAMHIDDTPRFSWRGLMLDSARHFQSVDEIKRLLDAMALHKLNVFHWHLTDDQGWRIEIRKYPKLTEVGGCRIPAGDAGIDPATGKPAPYCGYYTQDDIRDVVAYAAARHITIVPEIDVPGHATAAIAAYPQLGTEGKQIPVTAYRGIHSNLFNVEEGTFRFLDDVFAEVAQLFPGDYIHIGGDEALKDQWQASKPVQAKIRALGLADETALQSWFVHRLEAILHAHGKRLLGWDEILEGGLSPDATVMSWRGIEGGIEAAKQGHDVVMSPVSSLYFDYLQTDSPNEFPGRPAPRLLPMRKVYDFEPVPDELDESQRRHILGLQANMWTTDNRLFAGVEHNTFPRLLAVAETGWTPREKKDYASFLQRLPAWIKRYQALGIGYARTPFETILDARPDNREGHARIALANPLGYTIRYTLDGSTPTSASTPYGGPLSLKLPAKLRAAAFSAGEALDPVGDFDVTAAGLLTRTDEQLQQCAANGPVLRMDDDGPFDPEGKRRRALFNVAIMAPCWRWEDAPLDGIAGIEVRAGRLPYIFNQGAEEDAARKYLPAKNAHGELDVRAGSCAGETVASAPLPARPDADGFVTVHAPLRRKFDAADSLCIRFSGDFRPQMWALDRITLSPSP
ncbi:beta-hexosaminidase [Pseudoxanthomonas sangjuensis]|nr:beta-hexosaminidase [Pseudoxanthomonas sangjuensis]